MSLDIHLLHLIRRERLEEILQGFTEVSGIASIIADADGRPITRPYNFTPLCLHYCRSTEEGKRRCHLSDRYGGMETLRAGKAPIYHCLNAGLMDCAAPIIVEGCHLATILCGQVVEAPIDFDVGRKRARSIGVTDIDGYLEALEAVPVMSRERLMGIANLMAVITQTISELALQKVLQQKHSQHYLHKLINSVSDCIISTNRHDIISIVNEAGARMFGYEAEELIGRSIMTLFSDEESKKAYQHQLERESGSDFRFELQAVKSTRESFPTQVSVARIARDGMANAAGYVTVIRDISEQKRIERIKEDLIGMVAHDIKNPALSVQKAMELLVSGALGPLTTNQAEVMHLALDTSQQLFNMASNLLDIYRRENGEFLLDHAAVDMNSIVHESIGRLRLLARDRRVRIRFEASQSPCVIEGDRERLVRACVNLLENAVKYSPAGGEVGISSTRILPEESEMSLISFTGREVTPSYSGEPCVQIGISDEGWGIPEEYHQAVFEKFFTIKNEKTGGRRGLGLGLTFCKQIIEAHGGAIWVKSPTFQDDEGEMRGCAFQFVVPLKRGD